jgi:hypothetical protein
MLLRILDDSTPMKKISDPSMMRKNGQLSNPKPADTPKNPCLETIILEGSSGPLLSFLPKVQASEKKYPSRDHTVNLPSPTFQPIIARSSTVERLFYRRHPEWS